MAGGGFAPRVLHLLGLQITESSRKMETCVPWSFDAGWGMKYHEMIVFVSFFGILMLYQEVPGEINR